MNVLLKKLSLLGPMIVFFLFVIFFHPIVSHQFNQYHSPDRKKNSSISQKLYQELGLFMDSFEDQTVLSDPWTSYPLPYFTGAYVASMPPASGSPFIDHEARMRASVKFFSGTMGKSEAKKFLDRYHIDYILFNLDLYSGNHGGRSNNMTGYQMANQLAKTKNLILLHQGEKYILFRKTD